MLSYELMGLLGLGVLWLTALLIAGAAWQEWRDLRARRAQWLPLGAATDGVGLKSGVALATDRPGALAAHMIEQKGFAVVATRPTIEFCDGARRCELFGGVIRVADVELEITGPADVQVWPDAQRQLELSACPDAATFCEAYEKARKACGVWREVETPLRAGDRIWIAGRFSEAGRRVEAVDGVLLLSAMDPTRWSKKKETLVLGFIAGELLLCGLCTLLALWPPATVSTTSLIGGVASLAYFLGIQPVGNIVRDAVRPPHRARLRGRWVSPAQGAPVNQSRDALA